MSKSILLSIKPKYVADILNGKKTIEVRKVSPKCDLPIDVYIYCTNDNDLLCQLDNEWNTIRVVRGAKLKSICNGRVVAKFTLRKVEEIFTPSYITEDDNDYSCDIDELLKQSCLTEEELTNYIGEDNYHFFTYHIEDLVIFDKPKELSEFKKKHYPQYAGMSKNTIHYELEPIIKAPQSYCFIEVNE